jgi:hypothetical protein
MDVTLVFFKDTKIKHTISYDILGLILLVVIHLINTWLVEEFYLMGYKAL